MTKPNYKLITINRYTLEAEVNEAIEQGYIPCGGPFLIGTESYSTQDEWGHWHDDSEKIYCQALLLKR